MNPAQFDVQIERLRAVFGKKHFDNTQRLEMIWDIVGNLDYPDFCSLCDAMIENMRYAPLPVDFREAAKGKNRYLARDPVAEDRLECRLCFGSGLVTAKHNYSKRDLFMICACSNDSEKQKLRPIWPLPKWTKDFEREFTLVPIDPLYWKPKSFDPDHAENSLKEKAEEWKLRIKTSRIFWDEYFSSDGPDAA